MRHVGSAAAFPLCGGATRLGTPFYNLVRERIAGGVDFSGATRPSQGRPRAPQRF